MEENKIKEMTPLEALETIGKTLFKTYAGEGVNGYVYFSDEIKVIREALAKNTKASPIESYLFKRVKELEKENRKLTAKLVVESGHREYNAKCLAELASVCKELAQHFEIRTDESDKFDFSYFNGAYLHVINKSGDIEKCDKALIDFLNYVKENL